VCDCELANPNPPVDIVEFPNNAKPQIKLTEFSQFRVELKRLASLPNLEKKTTNCIQIGTSEVRLSSFKIEFDALLESSFPICVSVYLYRCLFLSFPTFSLLLHRCMMSPALSFASRILRASRIRSKVSSKEKLRFLQI